MADNRAGYERQIDRRQKGDFNRRKTTVIQQVFNIRAESEIFLKILFAPVSFSGHSDRDRSICFRSKIVRGAKGMSAQEFVGGHHLFSCHLEQLNGKWILASLDNE